MCFLLVCCISIDYADNNNTTAKNIDCKVDEINTTEVTIVNGTQVVQANGNGSYFVAKKSDKMYTIKQKTSKKAKVPVITMTGKPSCKCGKYSSYTWRTRTYVKWCPHCRKYNVLYNAHKYPARFEQEITCKHCGADYCINCGHEKYSWSNYYLRSA